MVAYTDSLIGEFRRAVVVRDLLSSSVFILTSVHGEGVGEHGVGMLGFLVYDTTVHVSLIVRPPTAADGGRVVDSAVSHVDIFPTVLDAVGLSAPKRVHGQSLLPLIVGEDFEARRGVYSESLYPLLHYGWSPLRAIRTDQYKLIGAPRPEVYDVRADRHEEHDLSGERPTVLEDLENKLAELKTEIEREDPTSGAGPDLDPQTLAQLQALGYAAGQGGVGLEEEGDRPRADPKDKIGLHRTIMRAQSELRADEEAAEQTLLAVLEEDPEIVDAHHMLGQIAAGQHRYEDSLGHFQRALEVAPDHKNSLLGMASSYRAMGRLDEAVVGFRRVLDVSGSDTRASLVIADIEFDRGRLDEAAAVLDEAATTTDAPSLIHNKLGEIRVEQGRVEEAMSLFEAAISENEGYAIPHFNLAVLLEERGEVQPAVAHYEEAIELAPKHHRAQFNLGRLVGRLGQVERQQELWETAIESEPDFVQGYYYLAKLLMDTGQDLERAEVLVREGIGKDPDHHEGPLGYYILADILNRNGRRAEAIEAVSTGRRIQAEMG